MGADLLITYIVVKEGDTIEKKKSRLLKFVSELSEKDENCIRAYFEEAHGDVFAVVDEDDILNMDEVRKFITDVINEAFDCMGGSRDTMEIIYKGDLLIITGGMSWGDEPTDSYGSFHKLITFMGLFGLEEFAEGD